MGEVEGPTESSAGAACTHYLQWVGEWDPVACSGSESGHVWDSGQWNHLLSNDWHC